MEKNALLRLVDGMSSARKFSLGEVVFRERDPPDVGLCLVLSGSIQITSGSEGQSLNLGRIGPGGFFGEMALVLNRRRTANALAAENNTTVMFLTKERVLQETKKTLNS